MKNSTRRPKYANQPITSKMDRISRILAYIIGLAILALLLFGCESESGKRLANKSVIKASESQDSVKHWLTHVTTYKTPTTYYLRAAEGKYIITHNDDLNAYAINEKVILVSVHHLNDSTSNSYLIKYTDEPIQEGGDDDIYIINTLFTVEFKEINKHKKIYEE